MFGDLSSVLLGRFGVGEQTPSYDGSRQTKDPSKPGYDPGAAGNIRYNPQGSDAQDPGSAGNSGGIFAQILRQILSGQGGQGGVSRHLMGGFDPNRETLGGGINPNAGGGGQGSIPPNYIPGGSFSPEEKISGQTGYYTDSRDSGVPPGTWMPYGSEGAGGFTGSRRTDSSGHPIDSGGGLQIGQNPFEKFFPTGSTNGQFDPNNPSDVGFQNGDFMTAGGTPPWMRRANPNGPQ